MRDHAVLATQVLAQTRFANTAVQAAVAGNADIMHLSQWLIYQPWWQQLIHSTGLVIQAFHAEQPQALGMKLADLRTAVEKQLPDKRLFDPLLESLGTAGYVRSAGLIRSASHLAKLPPELHTAGDKLRRVLAMNPLEPPNPKELAPTAVDQKALKFLLDTGEAIFLDEKAIVLATAYEAMKRKTADCIRTHGKATVAQIREALGTTRRILVPLLERLDKEGFTKRDGDWRTLKSSS
jgi:selenocysteine-specific elongation factor